MLRPPCRKKIRVNSTSSAPVTISVTVAAVDSAPLVSLAWLLRSASMAELPALVIWSLLRCAGPSISHVRVVSMEWVTCSTSPGRPVTNWLTTNVSMPPTIATPLSSTSATAPPRGAPRRSRKSTAGIIKRGEHQRQCDRHHDDLEPPDHPEQRDGERDDHQQAPRPRRRLANERGDRLVVSRSDGGHAGSVTAGRRRPPLPCRACPTTRRQRTPAAKREPAAANTGGCDG